ncbi:uncharacterized protein LOC143864400 [Tasmannia lanceolata]|uniref:uncharacterized protein LOC143864400 n=1 Tax=Tasmannia lanceolata TaxID=3420 RepID=UPI00406448A5
MQALRVVVSTCKRPAARFLPFKRVFKEIPYAVRGSNIQWRGRSFAASVPSDSSKPQRGQKRISRQERRAIVESFVHKYRASNEGKFPTPSLARKQVGGSYYVIRQIIQEMEYACRMSPISNMDELKMEKAEKVTIPHLDVKEESQISTKVEESSVRKTRKHFAKKVQPTQIETALVEEGVSHVTSIRSPSTKLNMENVETSSIKGQPSYDSRLEMEVDRLSNERLEDISEDSSSHEESNVSITSESTTEMTAASSKPSNMQDFSAGHSIMGESFGHQKKLESGAESLRPLPKEVTSRKSEIASKGLQDSDGLKRDSVMKGDKKGPESKTFQRDASKKPEQEEEPSIKGSTLWGNLKSFADGIVQFWRKM